MSTEGELLLDRIGDAVAHHDLAALRDHLRLLGEMWERGDGTAASGQEIPPLDVLRLLRDTLPFREFLALTGGHPFRSADVYRLLDELALELPLEDIIEAAEALGIPPQNGAPGLRLRLASGPETRVIPWVEGFIWQRAAGEADRGQSLRARGLSGVAGTGQRESPADDGLSDAIRLVGERPGAASLSLLMRYLVLLPWGEDRQATVTLLTVLAQRPEAQARQAVRRALSNRTTPGPFRLFLLQALSQWSPATAACMILEDLAREMPEEDRVAMVELLDRVLPPAVDKGPRVVQDLCSRVAGLDTGAWPHEHRDRFRSVTWRHLPELAGEG